ncbi:MAG: argininosuccinate synthase [candidate division KSB1 bacterium]|jgi:argininosuccinate synthase|nr:argininosuccinate synthase [candidate division KSB1 bacterium]
MMNEDKKKNSRVVLAYSGGLDTTFCVEHLKESGYEVVTATVNTGGFSEDEMERIREKALKQGAVRHYGIDAEKKIYDQIISYVIRLNALYEGDYPLMCADRYVIAQEILEIAGKEGTDIVVHGSTAHGNDQVRFDSAFYTLNNRIKVMSLIKDLNVTREEEIVYLENKGIAVNTSSRKYSINENVFGVTVSGSEIDADKEPTSEAYKLTVKKKDLKPQYIDIEFKNGLPVALDGTAMNGLDMLKKLNTLVGAYGFGARMYTGDCIIGIKGHLLFEAPGLLTLIEAHRKLEQYTLTKKQLSFNNVAWECWTDLVYGGLYYEPVVSNIEAYADSVQKRVNGHVKIKLEENKITAVEIESRHSLIDESIATYAQQGSWDAKEADGFIKLYSLQQKIANSIEE